MTPVTDSGSVRSTLIDAANCIGCRLAVPRSPQAVE